MDELEKAHQEIESPPAPEEPKKGPGRPRKEKKEDNEIFTSFLETEEYILEQVKIATHATHATLPTDTEYIKYNKNSREIERIKSFEHEGKLYRPITGKILDKVVLLPTEATDYGDVDKLVKQLRKFFNDYFEAPKFSQNLFPYLVLFYWVYDRFPFIPYVHFMGLTGTGKTTAMEVFGSVCYKPINASGAITLASIFRIVSEWRGTLLIDEFAPGGESYREMLSLLKSGVSDQAVLRVEGERKRTVEAYIVKSPKLFTSEKPIMDIGLRSRVIEVHMEKNVKEVPLFRRNKFLVEAQKLRNKLLMWRLHKLEGIEDALDKLEYGFKSLQAFDGRTQQVITPIYYMANQEARKDIINFAKEQEEETLRERRESLDGQIFQFIIDKYDPNGMIEVTINMIFEFLTKGDQNKYMTERKIASIVRKILMFDIQRAGHENVSTLILGGREDRIRELCNYYGIPVPNYSVARVARVANNEKSSTKGIKGEQASIEDVKGIFGA